jgi:dTDP-glucose pyrophosphorylase/CBS domain-containing protein
MPRTPDPSLLVSPQASIREAITRIDANGRGIVLVVDSDYRLMGTVTDGDVRRALLSSVDLDTGVEKLLVRKHAHYAKPITAKAGTPPDVLREIMHRHVIHQIPILDDTGRVVDLVTSDDLINPETIPIQAVVMAGGFGSRMAPLTDHMPKPMLEVGGRPLLEHIVEQLQQSGVRRVSVTTHYKPEAIRDHFGNGEGFGVEMNYVNEDSPLGTAGALGLLPSPTEPLLVINGDILTQVDFRAMLTYHREHRAEMTIAVRRYEVKVPYGVVVCDGANVTALQEKPQMSLLVNAGIYLMEPSALGCIPQGRRFDMTDLIQALIAARRVVASFPVREYWLDIGQPADYVRAQEDYREGKLGT